MRIITLPAESENEVIDQFRQVDTTVKRATDEFRDSADKQAQCRRELVQVMKAQLASVTEMRENHERYRKTVKNALKDSNAAYVAYRTRDVPKVNTAKSRLESLSQFPNLEFMCSFEKLMSRNVMS
jgi:methyl-accepting chemotaxis protein